jgi:threonine aldolase
MSEIIDLRSDTMTKPSLAMREAIMNAEVGDDVFGEDATVNKLQEYCAELTGKEAALFTTSGVLANQLGIKCLTEPGDEVIVESNSHIMNYENAAPSVISNVQLLPVLGKNGIIKVSGIENSIRPDIYYFPRTSLICLENTHNRAGGVIYPIEIIREIRKFALSKNIKMHLDGARIFNAFVETGISIKEYASYFDSISFCFSKGLGAPVGSIFCSTKENIDKARKYRKILGGGMRQAGIIASAALYAVQNNIARLKDDNNNAKYFAERISKLPHIDIELENVQTNIVIFKIDIPVNKFKENLFDQGILMIEASNDTMRAVFHLGVSDKQTEIAVKIFTELLKN